jgi:hypothetical protein
MGLGKVAYLMVSGNREGQDRERQEEPKGKSYSQ